MEIRRRRSQENFVDAAVRAPLTCASVSRHMIARNSIEPPTSALGAEPSRLVVVVVGRGKRTCPADGET